MSRIAGVALVVVVAAIGMGAQSLPAMPPTTQPGQGVSPAVTPAANTPLHAEVLYTNGLLRIRADNSSLNQILRSISHVTGLKITGGVEEQRVFGSYGPAPLSTILATLLDGTGANILLLGGSNGANPELVLTQRAGGAEPPGPNSAVYAMYDDNNDRASAVAAAGSHAEATAAPIQTPQTPPVATGAAAPVAREPGQALTPEMVEQELLQMQAQQDQKKKELDDRMKKQQVDQNKKLNGAPPPSQPTNGSNPQ